MKPDISGLSRPETEAEPLAYFIPSRLRLRGFGAKLYNMLMDNVRDDTTATTDEQTMQVTPAASEVVIPHHNEPSLQPPAVSVPVTAEASAPSPSPSTQPAAAAVMPDEAPFSPPAAETPAGNTEAELYPSTAVSWTAAEFVARPKPSSWYFMLGGVMLVLMLIVWFLTKDTFATVTVAIGLLLLGIYARRQPHEQQYALDENGLTIGAHRYSYADFRSFSVTADGELARAELTPMKRFSLYTALYFNQADENKVVDVLSSHLPMDEPSNDPTDALMRRLHF
jgi:hypothetical protein